ncbi:hypothetical protein GIW05_03140 [Pseudomonas syringae]|uniref:hypothetical protein n=1 Tax=Pseudomonas syringae TaxID=317 RepID=UPI001F21F0A7|nr:hypothetical protein [Pseudomonas syringae]MCF5382500.1 hypothetical protein [Pseudomonas syringae]MCF5419387.1 hypothetical protein [Pseudomonas syringae]MCF5451934.1 hypothetical protein [Pseudomonas syringae]MCF5458718.1 hypothetical protein [Pseudomonas syringae]
MRGMIGTQIQFKADHMTHTFTRSITLTLKPVSLGAPLDEPALEHLRKDGYKRLQESLEMLIDQGISGGTFTYQEPAPVAHLNCSISVYESSLCTA